MKKTIKKELYILISESEVGAHAKLDSTEDFIVFKMTFIPKVIHDSEKDTYTPYVNLINNKSFKEIVRNYRMNKQYSSIKILVGFDADENGEFMAQALQQQLLLAGVKVIHMFRTPLTEDGYMAITPFLNIDRFCKFQYLQNKFMDGLRKRGLKPKGFRKLLSLEILHSRNKAKEDKVFNLNLEKAEEKNTINLNGTSTYTYIHNMLNEGDLNENA